MRSNRWIVAVFARPPTRPPRPTHVTGTRNHDDRPNIPMELLMGLEPMTSSLPRKCSTTELQQRDSFHPSPARPHRRLPTPGRGHDSAASEATRSKERAEGIEPSQPAWKAGALPLSYARAWYGSHDPALAPRHGLLAPRIDPILSCHSFLLYPHPGRSARDSTTSCPPSPTCKVVAREGFEPPKAMPADLQSAPFDRSGTWPLVHDAPTCEPICGRGEEIRDPATARKRSARPPDRRTRSPQTRRTATPYFPQEVPPKGPPPRKCYKLLPIAYFLTSCLIRLRGFEPRSNSQPSMLMLIRLRLHDLDAKPTYGAAVELAEGVEPTTVRLQGGCSTVELR